MECGGKSANVVLDDADAEVAIDGAVYAMFYHAGQCCEAGSRLFLPAARHDELLERCATRSAASRMGDPGRKETDMGPLISAAQRAKVLAYIESAQQEGASTGLRRTDSRGAAPGSGLVRCTDGVRRGEARDAHCTRGGFRAGSVCASLRERRSVGRHGQPLGLRPCRRHLEWDRDRAGALAARMRTGTVWINDYHRFDAHAPFGGFKQSGIGREFGDEGLQEYTEPQYVYFGEEYSDDLRSRFKAVVPD